MKKNLVFAISAFIAGSIASVSCDSTPSTKVSLATEIDSISYSYGASVGESLDGALVQMKILADTFAVNSEYGYKIEAEQDEAKKASLAKERKNKIDSIQKANEHATIQFLQGFDKALNSRASQSSYNFGYSVGSQLAMQSEMLIEQFYGENSDKEVNKKAIAAAVAASVQKKSPAMMNASSYLMVKSQEMQQQEMQKKQEEGEANKKAGAEFLEANKSKEGVVALESGVQYKIIEEGTGAKPKLTDKVSCHYHGTLLDGTVFDSSVNRGEPASFPLQGVISGWTEVLQLMPVGSKWEVFIPYDKAYGEQGSGGDIGAFETLKFEIELLEIEE